MEKFTWSVLGIVGYSLVSCTLSAINRDTIQVYRTRAQQNWVGGGSSWSSKNISRIIIRLINLSVAKCGTKTAIAIRYICPRVVAASDDDEHHHDRLGQLVVWIFTFRCDSFSPLVLVVVLVTQSDAISIDIARHMDGGLCFDGLSFVL